ncbi:hypothetical protein [Aromatoleum anaerobium]|uniref:Uncharacterized protein n=1 Tax=Aromatoleum anaerobium TaxID=182180 RepID=A0ABX1PG52_9RHOO|nr:hypothetical protein [Aromatoleum anaerobium]MCK0507536.1 hypothetical protein [Aromatoleum anaerobium]
MGVFSQPDQIVLGTILMALQGHLEAQAPQPRSRIWNTFPPDLASHLLQVLCHAWAGRRGKVQDIELKQNTGKRADCHGRCEQETGFRSRNARSTGETLGVS